MHTLRSGQASRIPPKIRMATTIASSTMTPEAVGESVAGRALHHEVVLRLRMEEEHGAHRLRRLEQRQEPRLVPVLAVHHGVELGALQAEDGHRALELADGRRHVLHGQAWRGPRSAGATARVIAAISSLTSRARASPTSCGEVVAEERRVD